jgi:hypothetical protein
MLSAVESTGIYPSNHNTLPEYFFYISDTSETVTFMETAPPDMAPICAPSTSETKSKIVLLMLAGSSLSTLNTLPSDTSLQKVTPYRLLKFSAVPKMPKKYSILEK